MTRTPLALLGLIVACGSLLVAGQHPQTQRAPEPRTGTASISGRLVDGQTGRPIAGALVNVYRRPYVEGLPSGVTDAAGRFEIEELPGGEYQISSSPAGYHERAGHGQRRPHGHTPTIRLDDGGRVTGVLVNAWRGASLSGRVFDERGRPVPGVAVHSVKRRRDYADRWSGASFSTSNDLGEYRITGLLPGTYTVATRLPMHNRVAADAQPVEDVNIGGPESAAPVALPSVRLLMDPDGTRAMLFNGVPLPAPDPQGRPRSYIPAFAGGATAAAARFVKVAAGEEQTGLDVVLEARRVFRVAGTITNPLGPIAGAIVKLVPENWGGPEQLSEITANADADGSFAMLRVPAGSYQLFAWRRVPPLRDIAVDSKGGLQAPADHVLDRAPESPWIRMPITVGDSNITDLSLMLRLGTKITGVFDGGPAAPSGTWPRASAHIEKPGDDLFVSTLTLRGEEDGTFTSHVIPGRYWVSSAYTGSEGWFFKGVTVNGRDVGRGPIDVGTEDITGIILEFTDAPTQLHIVTPVQDEQPDGIAVVFPVERDRWAPLPPSAEQPFAIRSGPIEAGRHTFKGLPAGEYYVNVVDDAIMGDWPSPDLLSSIAKHSTRVRLADAESRSVIIPVRER